MKENRENISKAKDSTKKQSNKNHKEEVEAVPCTGCGKNDCVNGTEFCEACLVEMLNTRIPFMGWIAGAASLVVSVVAIAAIVFLVSPSILAVRAEKATREKNWNDAVFYYNQMDKTLEDFRNLIEWQEGEPEPFLRRFFDIGANTQAKMFKAYAVMYDPLTAVDMLEVNDNTPLTKTRLAKPYWDQFKRIENTVDILFYSGKVPEEDNYECSLDLIAEVEQRPDVDKVYISYVRYQMAAVYYNQPIEESLKWLNECDKRAKASDSDYRWMYYHDLAEIHNVMGNPDKALALMDELVEDNRNNFEAYKHKNDILIENGRLSEAEKFVNGLVEEFGNYTETQEMQLKVARCKGEYDKVMVLGDALMANYAASPETYRQMALMFIATGDYKSAFEYIDNGFSYCNLLNQEENVEAELEKIKEICFICAKLYEKHGEPTDAEKVKLANIYYMFPEDYKGTPEGEAIINGEKDAKVILTQGDYDLL